MLATLAGLPGASRDIALVQLTGPATLSSQVLPVCLLAASTDISPGTWCCVGEPLVPLNILQEAPVSTVEAETCRDYPSQDGSVFQLDMLCAGGPRGHLPVWRVSGVPDRCGSHHFHEAGVVA
ncbi:tryptase gamma [Ochotona princeps]|uniref:tryptase gamma n=1 Tax=Ochotona princeps TaxID=9978 RepID=UPI0027153995|nr:tryptase gamma [Ochotona princeps]